MATRAEMADSFGTQAQAYEAGRPEYPTAAVAYAIAGTGEHPRVADVGAGTGKLTRALIAHGADVTAVEPDARMLQTLSASLPHVPAVLGRAEHLPLQDGSMDAVVFGQAWHWVQPEPGSAEAGRVLRYGGVLGLLWNIRDEREDWVARMGEIMHPSASELLIAEGGPTLAAPFGELEHASFPWVRPMTRAQLVAMVSSRSYVITATPEERARIDVELAVLFDEIGAVGDKAVQMPYLTEVFRARRP